MIELFSFKPKCNSKTYAMTNVKYILPWNPVYKNEETNFERNAREAKLFRMRVQTSVKNK